MTIQQAREQGLSAAQQNLIEFVEDFNKDGISVSKSELQPQQRTTAVILEKRGYITIAKNGDIILTEKSKEDTTMATKKAEKVDDKVLKAVAKDLNDVLGLEPAIDPKAKDLLERVKEESAQVGVDPKTGKVDPKLVAGDKKELQKETWEFLEQHGMLGHLDTEVAEEEEEEEEVEEKEEKSVAKKTGKKAPVEKAEKPVKKEKVVKPAKEKKISSRMVVADIVQEGKHTYDDVVKLASKKNIPVPHIKMYLKAWGKKDRVPFNMEVLHTTKEGILKFK